MQNIAVIYLLDAVPRKMLFFSAKEGGISQWLELSFTLTNSEQQIAFIPSLIHTHNPSAHSDLANDTVQFNLFNVLFKVVGIRWLVVS